MIRRQLDGVVLIGEKARKPATNGVAKAPPLEAKWDIGFVDDDELRAEGTRRFLTFATHKELTFKMRQ